MEDKIIENIRAATQLTTADFDYDLPKELIAQHPSPRRDTCRLFVLDRASGKNSHEFFYDIVKHLRPEDILVVNSSKVIPARLLGICDKNGAPMELLLLRAQPDGLWETLVRPGKRAGVGATFTFGAALRGKVCAIAEGGNRLVSFTYDTQKYPNIYAVLDEVGNMPLPPYITEKLKDKNSYQTVYAKQEGSAAAPTAGLHFTKQLLDRIRAAGVGYAEVMLHVGLGTFRPVKVDRIEEHLMHAEQFVITDEAAAEINRRRAAGGRIIAVGTTACRVLESAADEQGILHGMSGETRIFIYPGYQFRAVDALITNFHLPESTLVMLVAALCGRERILDAYREAIQMRYRFFSFGDAMLIV